MGKQIKPSAVTAQDTFQEHIEKLDHIHLVIYHRIMRSAVKIMSIYDALPSADAIFRNFHVRRKSAAHFWVQKAGDGQRIIDHTADQMLPLPVKSK